MSVVASHARGAVAQDVTADMLGHSHLSSSRTPRMSQIMEREIDDLRLSARARERFLSVNESRSTLVAGEDIFARGLIFTQSS